MFRIIIICLALLATYSCIAQKTNLQSFEAFKDRAKYLLGHGGEWEAVNPKYDENNEWSPKTFGYKFEVGYAENVFVVKINGVVKNKRYLYWDGYYYWDPVLHKACYRSIGTSGQIATGESVNNDGDLMFTILHPEGKITYHLDTDETVSEDEFKSLSYIYEDGKWMPNNELHWKRVIDDKK